MDGAMENDLKLNADCIALNSLKECECAHPDVNAMCMLITRTTTARIVDRPLLNNKKSNVNKSAFQ